MKNKTRVTHQRIRGWSAIVQSRLTVAFTMPFMSSAAGAFAEPALFSVEYNSVSAESLMPDVCVPDSVNNTTENPGLRPVVIVVHGGEWGSGDRKTMMTSILILEGTEDRTVPMQQAINIQRNIQEKKWRVPCEVYRVEGDPHRQSERDSHDLSCRKKMLDWLGDHF